MLALENGMPMARLKEFSEVFRKEVIDGYESVEGFKKISEEIEISHSTVQKIIYLCNI